jgi:hypothetical protein
MKTHLDRRGSAGVPSRERTRRDRSPTSAKDVGEGIGESVGDGVGLVADPKTFGIEGWLAHLYTIKGLRTVDTSPRNPLAGPFSTSRAVPSIRDRESCDSSPVSSISVPLSLSEHTESDPSSE